MEKVDLKSEHVLDIKSMPLRYKNSLRDRTYHCLAKNMFGKTFYIVYNGMLRQMRIIKGYFFFGYYDYRTSSRYTKLDNVYEIEVAGIGRLFVKCNLDNGLLPCTLYATIENYKDRIPVEQQEQVLPTKEVQSLVMKKFRCALRLDGVYTYTIRYKWDGVQVLSYLIDTPIHLEYDADGFHAPDWNDTDNGYDHKKDCESANEVQVCTFDGEEPMGEERKKVNILGLDVALTDSDIRKVKNFLDTL